MSSDKNLKSRSAEKLEARQKNLKNSFVLHAPVYSFLNPHQMIARKFLCGGGSCT